MTFLTHMYMIPHSSISSLCRKCASNDEHVQTAFNSQCDIFSSHPDPKHTFNFYTTSFTFDDNEHSTASSTPSRLLSHPSRRFVTFLSTTNSDDLRPSARSLHADSKAISIKSIWFVAYGLWNLSRPLCVFESSESRNVVLHYVNHRLQRFNSPTSAFNLIVKG